MTWTYKAESVGRDFFCNIFVLSLDVSTKIRTFPIFALILDKFCLQTLITSLKVVQFTSFFVRYDPQSKKPR